VIGGFWLHGQTVSTADSANALATQVSQMQQVMPLALIETSRLSACGP
jgi:hypothetical protein